MMGIGVHICDACGAVFDTIGGFLDHWEEAHSGTDVEPELIDGPGGEE